MIIIKWVFWTFLAGRFASLKLCWQSKVSTVIAFCAYFVMRRRRSIIHSELEQCLENSHSKLEIIRLVRSSFKIYINTQIKMLSIPRMNAGNIDDYISVSGLEMLRQVLKKNRGVILLNPHFGPFLLAMAGLGHRGFQLNQLAIIGEPPNRKRKGFAKKIYKAKFNTIENNLPANFINAAENRFALRHALRALKEKQIVIFASTGRAGNAWHKLPFLNRKAMFNLTPFKLALKTGSPLLPVFVVDTGSSPMAEITVENPIPVHGGDTAEQLLSRYVHLLEQYVMNQPDHFASFLYEMHMNSEWDDHPFFDNYQMNVRRL